MRREEGPMRSLCISASARGLAVAAIVFLLARPLAAHHSFAMFDAVNKTTISGSVVRFEWTNPHVQIEIDVPGQNGAPPAPWTVELGSPSILLRSGWKYSDVKAGDKVTATINPLHDGRHGGMLYRLTLADGRVFGNGTAPPPAPVPAK
jgi:hypothetical protein